MRKVEFDPSLLEGDDKKWWARWRKRADNATDNVIEAWEEWLAAWLAANPEDRKRFAYEFNSAVWSDLKAWLLKKVFFKKCAYCEAPITRFYGDAEHRRPKGRVSIRNEAGDPVPVVCEVGLENGPEMQHPGYFWLAYNWKNLVPSCEFCNTGEGKQDLYPAISRHVIMKRLSLAERAALKDTPIESKKWPGAYYLGPTDLDAYEAPLLVNSLNPVTDREPKRHLRFGVRGIITASEGSDIGQETIKVLRPDDDDLERERAKAQHNIHRVYFGKYADPTVTDEDLNKSIADFLIGREAYSIAALEYLDLKKAYLARSPDH